MTQVLRAFGLAAMALPTLAVAQPVPPGPHLSGTRLDVNAEGEVTRAPDFASIDAGVVTQADTAAVAMQDNARRMAATVAALKKAGVADRDIQTSAISLSPRYRYGENQPPVITGYEASNRVTVRFRDIARAGSILDTLVTVGANQISGPNFLIDKPDAALDEARVQALQKARARADLYARAAGLRVKRIIAISEQGGYSPPQPFPQMMRAASPMEKADTHIAPGEQRVSVSVSVIFELE